MKILDDTSLVLYFVEYNQFSLACKLEKMTSNRLCEQNWQCRYLGLYHLILSAWTRNCQIFVHMCIVFWPSHEIYRIYHYNIMSILFIAKFKKINLVLKLSSL